MDMKESLFQLFVNQTVLENCDNINKTRDPNSYIRTYWSYFTVYACFMMFTGASFSLFDGIVMALQKECSVDYGLQRAWGTMAALFASYLGGALVDSYSTGSNSKDFTLMFFSSGVCFVIAGLITFSVNMSFKIPATNFSRDLWRDIKKFDVVTLMCLIVFKGFFMSYSETFMYLFMSKLGASSSLIGLTVTVGASFEICLQLLATPLTKYLGKITVISIGILCYSVRFAGFSFVYNPSVMLYLEAFDSWASGLTITTIVMYGSAIASPTTVASMRGLIGILHDGIGRFLGARVGIEIKDTFGERMSFWIMAIWAFLVATVYFIMMKFYKIFVKKKFRRNYALNTNRNKVNVEIYEGTSAQEKSVDNPAFQV